MTLSEWTFVQKPNKERMGEEEERRGEGGGGRRRRRRRQCNWKKFDWRETNEKKKAKQAAWAGAGQKRSMDHGAVRIVHQAAYDVSPVDGRAELFKPLEALRVASHWPVRDGEVERGDGREPVLKHH